MLDADGRDAAPALPAAPDAGTGDIPESDTPVSDAPSGSAAAGAPITPRVEPQKPRRARSAGSGSSPRAKPRTGVVSESIRRFAGQYPFPLDDFQFEAIHALDAGRSVLAAAPTGTGKTVLAEFGIHLAREQGLRVIYTSPIKALSNQKFRDWRAQFGAETVGLLTGDVTERPDGSILVMTTEVLRNMLLQAPHALDDVACVIFDEVHFLADPERGTTWEEAILYCPKFVQLICLSATVANADEIATWISHVHRETVLVTHSTRAVPLEHSYYLDGELHLLVDATGQPVEPLKVGGESRYPRPPGAGRGKPREVPQPRDVVQALGRAEMLPAIYFLFSRRACEIGAQDCAALELVAGRESRQRRQERIRAYMDLLEPEDRQLEQVQRLVALLYRGIAFHHAGLLPLLKGLVEELFAAGLIGVVFATETLALGINMPARSVVIAEQVKYDGQVRRPLLPNEYAQLVGRAGRRGLDPKGYAVALYSPWMSCAEVEDIITGDLLPIRSSFTPRYNTVAALWDGSAAARDRLVRLFASSLRQFQINDALREAAAEVETLRARVDAVHYRCPYEGVPDLAVVEYGRLRRELSDARKRAQRAQTDLALLRRRLTRPPWPAPAPDAVRKEMQHFSGGEVVYVSGARDLSNDGADLSALRPGSWGVFLRRQGGGPGLMLVDAKVEAIRQWGDITRLPDGKPAIDLPDALREVEGPVKDARKLVGPRVWRQVQTAIRRLDLPDLPGVEGRRLESARAQAARDLSGAADRETRLEDAVHQVEQAVAAHPCNACPVRGEHEGAIKREVATARTLADAERHAAELEQAAASQAQRTLNALTSVMARFGFLEQAARPGENGAQGERRRQQDAPLTGPRTDVEAGSAVLRPTELSAVLSRVYDPNGLLLLTMVWKGQLDHLTAAEMMEVLSWFCYDREGPRWNRHQLTPRLWELRPELGEAIGAVQRIEAQEELAITTGANSAFFGPVLAWCRGATFAELLELIPISEGDLLLTLNKALDLGTQLREALRAGAPDHAQARRLAAKLDVGDRLLRRGIVAQSLRLAAGLPAPDADLRSAGDGAMPPLAGVPRARRRSSPAPAR